MMNDREINRLEAKKTPLPMKREKPE